MPKKILLTWYGITDLRASFGFELQGPVLGALVAETYDKVVVLGYSDDAKQSALNSFADDVLTRARASVSRGDVASERSLVSRFSNTRQAHKSYCEWLRRELLSRGIGTSLAFRPIHLKALNDTEGIYEAATTALSDAAAEADDVAVSLFVSPGTPVMAFVWAFASLLFPRVKKRLISSSRSGLPPETIPLPTDWLEWNGRRTKGAMLPHKDFDVMFHLFGDERLPSYWGVSQYASRYHVFVTSEKYDPSVLAPFLNGARPVVLQVKAFDPEDVRAKILDALAQMRAPVSAKIGFNLTGGTKLMYAGAMAACRKVNGTPLYFNQQENCVVDLLSFEKTQIKPIESVETFLKLNSPSNKLSCRGDWNAIPDIQVKGRSDLTMFLWRNRKRVGEIYKYIVALTDPRKMEDRDAKRKAREGCASFTYPEPGKSGANGISTAAEWDGSAEFTMGKAAFQFDHFPYFQKYITGGWFEEYAYSQLLPLVNDGLIHDLRIGVVLSFPSVKGECQYQEFDLMFTDGSRLYIVECKAGRVESRYVDKLNNETREYGGSSGRGFLVCCYPPADPAVAKRISECRTCRLVSGVDIAEQIRSAIMEDRKSYV